MTDESHTARKNMDQPHSNLRNPFPKRSGSVMIQLSATGSLHLPSTVFEILHPHPEKMNYGTSEGNTRCRTVTVS